MSGGREITPSRGAGIGERPVPRRGTLEANRRLQNRAVRREILDVLIPRVQAGTAAERGSIVPEEDPSEVARLVRSAAVLRPLVHALAQEQGREFTPEERDALGIAEQKKKPNDDGDYGAKTVFSV